MLILIVDGIEYVASEGSSRAGWTDMHCFNDNGQAVSVHSIPSDILRGDFRGSVFTGGHRYQVKRA